MIGRERLQQRLVLRRDLTQKQGIHDSRGPHQISQRGAIAGRQCVESRRSIAPC